MRLIKFGCGALLLFAIGCSPKLSENGAANVSLPVPDKQFTLVKEIRPESSPERLRVHKLDKLGTKVETEIHFRDEHVATIGWDVGDDGKPVRATAKEVFKDGSYVVFDISKDGKSCESQTHYTADGKRTKIKRLENGKMTVITFHEGTDKHYCKEILVPDENQPGFIKQVLRTYFAEDGTTVIAEGESRFMGPSMEFSRFLYWRGKDGKIAFATISQHNGRTYGFTRYHPQGDKVRQYQATFMAGRLHLAQQFDEKGERPILMIQRNLRPLSPNVAFDYYMIDPATKQMSGRGSLDQDMKIVEQWSIDPNNQFGVKTNKDAGKTLVDPKLVSMPDVPEMRVTDLKAEKDHLEDILAD